MSFAHKFNNGEKFGTGLRAVKKLCDQGLLQQALLCLQGSCQSIPDQVISYLVQCCLDKKDLLVGREILALVTKNGSLLNAYVGSYLVRMFDACGSLVEANEVFHKVSAHNCYTWSAIILAHVNHGDAKCGIDLYFQMHNAGRRPDEHTYVAVLKACIMVMDLALGKLIHGHVTESGLGMDVVIGNALVDMYGKCGSIVDGQSVFDTLPARNAVTWNALIGGYTQSGYGTVCLFWQMQYESIRPDTFTLVSMLKLCSIMHLLYQGKVLHVFALANGSATDKHVGSSLIEMYSKIGHIAMACGVFEGLPRKNLVVWNSMIAGYVQQGHFGDALHLHHQLQEVAMEAPDSLTYISILKACSGLGDVEYGKWIHTCTVKCGFESDVFVGNTLIDMYAKAGHIAEAENVFGELPIRDVVTWNALISAYAQRGDFQVAFELFLRMKQSGIEPDTTTWNAIIAGCAQHGHGEQALQVFYLMQEDRRRPDNLTFSSILKACSNLTAVDQGKLMHAYAVENGEMDAFIKCSLVDMYMKSGSHEDACGVFVGLVVGDVVTCNAMLMGLALHNHYDLVASFFNNMRQQGVEPDKVTTVSLLSSCSRLGLVEAACGHIRAVTLDHGLLPTLWHYNCIVDILGRVGRFDEAKDLLQTIPFRYGILRWTSLLTSCRTYGDLGVARECFDEIVAFDDTYGSPYAILYSMYVDALLSEEAGSK